MLIFFLIVGACTALAILIVLFTMNRRSAPSASEENKHDGGTTPPPHTEPATPPPSGTHGDGHGHGHGKSGPLSWGASFALFVGTLVLAGFAIIWLLKTPGVASSSFGAERVSYDLNVSNYECGPKPSDATMHPASPKEWVTVSIDQGYLFCPAEQDWKTKVTETECRWDGKWGPCTDTFTDIRFKSVGPVSTWVIPYRSM